MSSISEWTPRSRPLKMCKILEAATYFLKVHVCTISRFDNCLLTSALTAALQSRAPVLTPLTFKMGRWIQYDEDDYRLPEGMERIGYDADTMQYYFRDRDGSVWQGAEGAEFGEMTRVDRLPSSVVPHRHQRQPPTPHQPLSLSTEPSRSRPMADRSTIKMGSCRTLFPFSLLSPPSFSLSRVSSSRRDSRSLQKNVRKAHHSTAPSPATVSEKYRERKEGRSKFSKKSIQMSFVTLSRHVSARLPSFRVKPLQPVTINPKHGGKTKAINSRFPSVNLRLGGKRISILRRLPRNK